ncbi:MAG: sigma-70 family RNA polymerase sigma factor [Ruminococcus sp.]|nr:sigma-70 family RNA polymerase sigma factor [Ruminococcus sp.]MBQ3916260.1 sigma-70 family RNA polymerase sigma factor [Ruminococcus sp.]
MTQQESEKVRQLYLLYEQPMYRIAFAVLKQQESAEDAVSDAFIRIINRLNKIGDPASEKTKAYIIRVIKSAAIDQYRKNKIFYTRQQSMDNDDFALQIPDNTDVESDVLDRVPLQFLDELSPGDRQLVNLRCIHGLSWRDTAKRLSIGEAAARKRFQRIRKRLSSMKEGSDHE